MNYNYFQPLYTRLRHVTSDPDPFLATNQGELEFVGSTFVGHGHQ